MKQRPDLMKRTRGAALLTAMLTVTLVATFAAAALWQQWRAVEVEAAERARVQSAWVLIGALDWSRLILREDARAGAGGADHLAEPWAVPLEEARLSSFLAADKNIASDALEGLPDAFLSGRIVDAQSKLNVRNLVDGGKPVADSVAAFTKLFELLGLPAQEVTALTANLQRALPAAPAAAPDPDVGGAHHRPTAPHRADRHHRDRGRHLGHRPLMPQRTAPTGLARPVARHRGGAGALRHRPAACAPRSTSTPPAPKRCSPACPRSTWPAPSAWWRSARAATSAAWTTRAALIAAKLGQFTEGQHSVSTQLLRSAGPAAAGPHLGRGAFAAAARRHRGAHRVARTWRRRHVRGTETLKRTASSR